MNPQPSAPPSRSPRRPRSFRRLLPIALLLVPIGLGLGYAGWYAWGEYHLRAAHKALEQFKAMVEATKKGDRPYLAERMDSARDEAAAWAAFAEDKNDDAMNLLRLVIKKQDEIGKGEVELPAREMLADMLMELNRPQEALAEYEKSLKTDPNRFNGLYGAARAAELAQQPQKAAGYYAQLLKNCEHSDRPELVRAKLKQLATSK